MGKGCLLRTKTYASSSKLTLENVDHTLPRTSPSHACLGISSICTSLVVVTVNPADLYRVLVCFVVVFVMVLA